jgi:ankyrin repeat protein
MNKFKMILIYIIIMTGFIFSIDSKTQDIHKAVLAGDFAQVKRLVAKNPELITALDSRGQTPLHNAIWEGHEKIARLLFANINDVNLRNARGQTPLFYAVYLGQKDMVELLLAKGATFGQKDIPGHYPIHYAAREGHEKILELLIRKGANLNVKSDEGKTPLALAVARGHKGVVELLLANNAEFKPEGEERIRLLHCAARMGNKVLVDRLILKGVDIPSKYEEKNKLLFDAITGGLVDLISILISKGAKVNVTDIYGSTPLHEAAAFGHKEIVRFLIKKGAYIHCKRPDGETPLHAARKAAQKEIVDLLIKKGAVESPKQFPILQGKYLGQKPPKMKAELFAPGLISTKNEESIYGFFNNAAFLIFCRVPPDFKDWANEPISIMKIKDGKWTKPYLSPHKRKWFYCYNTAPVGKTLVFSEWVTGEGSDSLNDIDLWIVEKKTKDWSTPELLSINSPEIDTCPTVTKNGTLYFFSSRKGGFGNHDIYKSRLENGKYVHVENLGSFINTNHNEIDPLIAADESYLIYCSKTLEGYGGYDFFVSFQKKDGSWTKPENMGEGINTSGHDERPYITEDGKYFFYTSTKSGNLDIYWVDAKIIEELKPEELK